MGILKDGTPAMEVYRSVRAKIIQKELKPGEPLTEHVKGEEPEIPLRPEPFIMSGGGFGRTGSLRFPPHYRAPAQQNPSVPEVVPSVNPGRTSGAKGFQAPVSGTASPSVSYTFFTEALRGRFAPRPHFH